MNVFYTLQLALILNKIDCTFANSIYHILTVAMNFGNEFERQRVLKIVSELSKELDTAVYAVGGIVRDIILERQRNDIDILVIGDGPAFAEKIAERLGIRDINIFKRFGTAHFAYNHFDYEFVGARKESYSEGSRKPEVTAASFEEDISRRDFTINTLAVSLHPDSFGELTDIYNGYEDIKKGIIRTPLDPYQTFDDDPLRIMRAFRFASQLNFHVVPEIMEAAGKMRSRLEIVSQERITDEFLKIIASPKPSLGLRLLYESKVMEIVFPEIARLAGVDQRKDFHHKDVFFHTLKVLDNVAEVSDNLWLRFAALVHDIAKPQTKRFVEGMGWTFHAHDEIGARMMKSLFRKYKLPFNRLNYVRNLVRLHLRPMALAKEEVTDSAVRRLIVEADEDLDDLITLCRADITSKNEYKVEAYLQNYDNVMQRVKEVKEKDNLRAFQSPVRGDEIMKLTGLPPSRAIGDIKSAIENAILEGEIPNTYEAAFDYFMKIKDNFIAEK